MPYNASVWSNKTSTKVQSCGASAEVEKLERVQQAVDFMSDYNIPIALHTDVLRWVRFYHGHQAQNVKKKDLLAQLPGAIQRQMVSCIFGEVCLRVCGTHDVQTHVPTDSYT